MSFWLGKKRDNTSEFDLQELEIMLKQSFQNRSDRDFFVDSPFSDFWGISKHDLQKGFWTKAYTFSETHEGLRIGFLRTAHPAYELKGGAKVVSWQTLLKDFSKLSYLKSKTTLRDFANKNKQLILELKNIRVGINTGKIFTAKDGRQVYMAHLRVDGAPHYIFSMVTNLS